MGQYCFIQATKETSSGSATTRYVGDNVVTALSDSNGALKKRGGTRRQSQKVLEREVCNDCCDCIRRGS